MITSRSNNGHRSDGPAPSEALPRPHVVEEIEEAALSVPSEDASSAALRSILIGAVLVGGLTWLARVVLGRQGGKRS